MVQVQRMVGSLFLSLFFSLYSLKKTLKSLNYQQSGTSEVGEAVLGRSMAFAIWPNTNPLVTKLIWISSDPSCNSQAETSRLRLPGTLSLVCSLDRGNSISSSSSSNSDGKKGSVSNSNYVVPLDSSNSFSSTRPLAEILRDLNKRIPDNIVKAQIHGDPDPSTSTFIPWYPANRILSFYTPGWCGEIRDVIFADNGSVTVVYRVTVRGSDGEAHHESNGTVPSGDGPISDMLQQLRKLLSAKLCSVRSWVVFVS